MREFTLNFIKAKIDKFISGELTIPEISTLTQTLYYCDLIHGDFHDLNQDIAKWKKTGYSPEYLDIMKWFREY